MFPLIVRQRSFGTQLAVVMAVVVSVVALALTAIVTSMMQAQIERDKGAALSAVGRSVTAGLGKNIRDRMQQVQQLVDAEDLWDAGLDSEKVIHALNWMKQLRPMPAWVGVADVNGRVLAATDGLLVGRDVKERPWFDRGLRDVHVGDAHLAKLLADLLPAPANGEPLRFIDFSAPIKREGKAVGVVGLHADLQALEAIAATFLPKNAVARHVEVYVLTRAGEVIYGPDRQASIDFEQLSSLIAALPAVQPGEQARPAVEIFWGDGERYLTTSWHLDDFTPGVDLGWRVLVRQPVDIAYAPARLATQRALVGSLLAAIVAVGFGFLLGGQLTRPMRQIAGAARDVEQGQPGAFIPEFNQNRELVQLSSALQSMTQRLEAMVQERTEQLNSANQELRALGEQQSAMLDNELVGIIRQNMLTRTAIWNNRAVARMFGYRIEELLHHPARMLYPDDASFARVGAEVRAAFAAGRDYITKLELRRKDGTPIWVHLQGSPLEERPNEALWMMTDVTAQEQYQQQVEYIAFHDALTGLPNRLLLADRIGQAVASATRSGHAAAVAYLDLDGFKAVNDTHGHEAGDQLLKEIARRAVEAVRADDTVARLGGDEFVLVLGGLADSSQCGHILKRALLSIAQPVQLDDGVEVTVSGSIGVAICPADGTAPRDLMTAADRAMYSAKRAGKGCIIFASNSDPKT
jgi:diguanylate cyclase (GGDEF)-like protein/PAS domain S-box-containing protein